MRSVWDAEESGVMRLPSGRLLRGRGLHQPIPSGAPPDFALYLLGKRPATPTWESRWVLWPDFRLPKDHDDALDALREAWIRSQRERVEIDCDGGHGRTATALACIAVLDGVPADKAVKFVRERYNPRAVETPWQRRYVAHFTAD
ncbi:protein-tyrosine phosphatase family protein [Arthrobacter sp. N199823]|uniref:protein-tyrosine phosphatase family protein n=1 Tax=Arthrobacter sp. N199823 TaxID=2058895 RepID=UPI000CE34084|nr:protein-tyrosine phosphatase family protein [Arthrobacter sp. N199823]